MPPGAEHLARQFYVDVLGFEEMPKPAELAARGGIWLVSGDVHVHLGSDPDFRPAKKAHPAFACGDYDEVMLRLRAHGIDIDAVEDVVSKRRHCYVFDPFGNRLELID